MLIPIEKAAQILVQGKYVLIVTTDSKLALVPSDKADLKISAAEAVNMMFYVVRPADPQDNLEAIQAQIEAKRAEMEEELRRPERLKEQYRKIRGDS